jgi:5-bromo-4-chloroindolyl phosphate hydrolysis protein
MPDCFVNSAPLPLLGIGYSIPFSFFGVVLSFVAFSIIFLVTISLKHIMEAQNFIW